MIGCSSNSPHELNYLFLTSYQVWFTHRFPYQVHTLLPSNVKMKEDKIRSIEVWKQMRDYRIKKIEDLQVEIDEINEKISKLAK